MKMIVKKLSDVAVEAVNKTMSDANERYKKFCKLSKKEYKEISNEWSVMTYDELYMLAEKKCGGLREILADDTKKYLQHLKRNIYLLIQRQQDCPNTQSLIF